MGAIPSDRAKTTIDNLLKDEDPETRIAAARSIVGARPEYAVRPVVNLFTDPATSDAAGAFVIELMKRKGTPERLATAIRALTLSKQQVEPLLRLVKSNGGNAAVEDAIRATAKLEDAAWKLTPELRADILARVSSTGSAARGESIYRHKDLKCIQCHAIGNAGGLVGPNLISVGGSSQPDYILESLLDPNAKLKQGYTTVTLPTKDLC